MKTNFDAVDLEILRTLQADGRITNADLAKAVSLSPPSVLQRVRAMERAGLIKGFHCHLDADRLGFRIQAWVQIGLALHQDQPIERFQKAVSALPEVVECHHVSGDFDFLLRVVVRDMKAYERFIREELTKIRGVGQIRSSFVLATTKDDPKLPF